MAVTFKCENCEQVKPINPRLKGNQKYCGAPACQRARKAAWQSNKMATDNEYRESQQDCQLQWQIKKPPSQYIAEYRENNLDYVETNREKQITRNQNRIRKYSEGIVVTIDTLSNETNADLITPAEQDHTGKIVKMDTLSLNINSTKDIRVLIQKSPRANDCKDGRVIDKHLLHEENPAVDQKKCSNK